MHVVPGPIDPAEMQRFLDSYMYRPEAFFVDEVVATDAAARRIEARFDTTRALPFAEQQRVGPAHPAHVSGPELVMATGSLGCLHAWFFHGCHWDEGWAGFGNRIHRADFRQLVRIGPPLRMVSQETRSRDGSRRVVLRLEFRFWQEDALVYFGDQTAMFIRAPDPG